MVKNKFKSIRTLQLILSFLILHLSASGGFYLAQATVRYVSHTGSNTPPYTTWATAADSIMSAINISVFGDTIYVANGVYEEQVIMIPGLSLIGAGMDSCVIDTRGIVTPSFWAVTTADSSLFKGFQILVSNGRVGGGIFTYTNAKMGMVTENLIKNTSLSIVVDNSTVEISKNKLLDTDDGILVFGLLGPSNPRIINNLFVEAGIQISVGSDIKPEIYSNIFFLKENASAYGGANSDTVKLFNNLIIAEEARYGIANSIIPSLNIGNEFFGNFNSRAINAEDFNVILNNNVTNGINGIVQDINDNPVVMYNNSWNNQVNYGGFLPDSTNLSVDPMIVNEDTTKGELDFHLQMFSPLIDAGDPNILDVDGSRSDIGLYGGPFGERYTYQDLAPKPPRNLSAVVDSEYITLSWNRNTEADFKNYILYRDTVANFTADSSTFVTSLTDTFYQHIIPPGIDAFYYKLTATDNQGNESGPSEELAVIITSVNEYPLTVSNYQLYQNYPNPFNPSTKIAYKLKERGYVKLMVYDIKGELVSMLVNQVQDAGYYEVEFGSGSGYQIPESGIGNLASGIYIYQIMIKSENNIPVFTDMKKMVLIK